MNKEIKPSELKNFSEVKHIKSSDGLTYEKDIYIFKKPIFIELKSEESKGYININKRIKEIIMSSNISSMRVQMTLKLETDTEISFSSYYKDYFTLIMR